MSSSNESEEISTNNLSDITCEDHDSEPMSAVNLLSYFNLCLRNSGLRLGHWNINCLTAAKFEQIRLMLTVNNTKLDMLFLSETFLHSTICDSLYKILGYKLFRKDRMDKKGGGLAVYCSDRLRFRRREDLETISTEILWLEVYPFKSQRSLLIAGCYRPPSNTKEQDKEFEKCIETATLMIREYMISII